MRLSKLCQSGMAAAILLALGGSALAQGTPEQQEACKPDVFRLCGNYIPDVDRIVACLRANEPQLSSACHDVMFDPPPAVEKPKPKVPKTKVRRIGLL